MLDKILKIAKEDFRIRGVFLNGSRADSDATKDEYCDYDIVYLVENLQSFTNDKEWYKVFGEILIMQTPDDWYNEPYDYSGKENFHYLMQFTDGNRIDLTLVDTGNITWVRENKEPRKILLNKDNREELYDITSTSIYNITPPGEKEFHDCCNEFWWLSLYVAKGLCREEFLYAKIHMEHYQMPMLIKMLNWSIAMDHDFSISTGKCSKYLKRFLSKEEMQNFMALFPEGGYEAIWEKLFLQYVFFNKVAVKVAEYFGWKYDTTEFQKVIDYAREMKTNVTGREILF